MCAQQIAALVAAASSEEGRPSTIRGAIDALEAVAQSRNEAALSALFGLAKNSALRESVAVAFASVALRQPDWAVERLNAADGPTRESAITMLKDGFDSLEEDFAEEQFFASVRARLLARRRWFRRTLACLDPHSETRVLTSGTR